LFVKPINMKKLGFALCLIFVFNILAVAQSAQLTIDQLIDAVTTRPWPGQNFPALPNLPTYVRSNLFGDLGQKETREAFQKLDAKRRNIEWFEGIEVLIEHKAVWALQACLAHPSEDVQIKALRGLGMLKDKSSVPFLLIYAEYMTEFESGSENATIHGIVQETIAQTLFSITKIKVEIKGQDPEGLKKGIKLWRKWLLDNG
jgi:hypothetical protein